MDQIEIHWLWWLVAAIGLGVFEVLTLDLVLLMLAGGAVAALVASALGAGVTVQVLSFAFTSVVMLVFIRPYLLRNVRKRIPLVETNTAAHVGRQAVTMSVVTDRAGLVKLAGEEWSARTAAPELTFPPDTVVRVVSIDGATAIVGPLDATTGPSAVPTAGAPDNPTG